MRERCIPGEHLFSSDDEGASLVVLIVRTLRFLRLALLIEAISEAFSLESTTGDDDRFLSIRDGSGLSRY